MLIPANPRGGFWLHVTKPNKIQVRLCFSNEMQDLFQIDTSTTVVVTRHGNKIAFEFVDKNTDGRSRAISNEGPRRSLATFVPYKKYNDVPAGSYRPIVTGSRSFEIDYSGMLAQQA